MIKGKKYKNTIQIHIGKTNYPKIDCNLVYLFLI